MEKTQTLEEFYKSKLNWMPDNLQKEMGHFNVFRLDEFSGPKARILPYSRKNYYKISLINGHTRLFYADKTIEFDTSALLFANPQIPYSWESDAEQQTGYFCIFTEAFFNQFGHIKEYPVFKPGDNPLFHLSPSEVDKISQIFLRMLQEIESDFTYKYDVLRTLVLELIHLALKMQPAKGSQYNESNGNLRVSSMFTELLERQFPVESPGQRLKMRSPVEFAGQLSVHVNHLNRSLKEVTGKTTSALIAERVIQEARTLLRHTDWNVSEIAWCLGFDEAPHFVNFFKKNVQLTPKRFRQNRDV